MSTHYGRDVRSRTNGKYYDFIEVGTADHSTITHFCARHEQKHAAWIGNEIWSTLDDLRWARGLAVDPIFYHLQALPDLPHVEKVQAAMDEWSGENRFYAVSPESIMRHMGAYHTYFSTDSWAWEVDVMWYAGSLGSLGKPHPNLEFMLRNIGRSDLLESKLVDVYDWRGLCHKYNVRSVDVVQLDCEGRDCAILRGMLRHCEKNSLWLPRVIQFEANHLTPRAEVESTVQSLISSGFHVSHRTQNNIMVKRDY